MKLPKPKKLNIPKPAGGKLPALGKFHIKNRFLKKNLLSMIVAAVLIAGTGTVYGTLSSQVADRGQDPVNGVNQDRYQVLVSGKGYKLSKQQEKNYKLQKKQNKINAANAMQNPQTMTTPSGSRVYRSSSSSYRYRYRPSVHSYTPSKTPRITSDVSTEIAKLDDPVAGDTFNIRVSAYAYPYGTTNAIDSNNIRVTVDGGSASLYKSKAGSHYYKITLGKGKNKITISATDKKTKKTVKIGPYSVKVGTGSSNTDPTQGTETPTEPEKTKVTVDYGLGAFTSGEVTIDDSTKAIDILSKTPGVKVKDGEIKYIEFDEDGFEIDEFKDTFIVELTQASGKEPEDPEFDTWFSENVDNVIRIDGGKIRLGTWNDKGYPFKSTKWEFSPEGGKALANGITLSLVLYEE